MPPKISLLKLTQGETTKKLYEKYQIIQDMLVPLDKLSEAMEVFEKEIQVEKFNRNEQIFLPNLYSVFLPPPPHIICNVSLTIFTKFIFSISLTGTLHLFKWQMYPLWLCPFILYDQPGMVHPPQKGDQLYVDIGAYGSPKSSTWEAVKTTKALEAYVIKSGGYVQQILQKLGGRGPNYRKW